MTLSRQTAEIWGEYTDRAMEGCKVAETTDRATAALLDVFRKSGLAFPGDDRCAEIEALVYRYAKECNPKHFA
jgi:hypothetical protein